MKARYWIAIIIAGILIGVPAYHYLTRLGPGDPAPDFNLPDIAGTMHSLDEYRDDIVLLHFWATWCNICIKEIPAIQHIHKMFEDRGLKVVSVLEDGEHSDESLQAFKLRHPIGFTVLRDDDGSVAALYESYGVPETFIIGRDGIIINRFSGGIDWDGLPYISYMESLLRKR